YLTDDLHPKIPNILKGLKYYSRFTEQLLSKPIAKSKTVFNNKKVTDHHAIIPTGVAPSGISPAENKIYDLGGLDIKAEGTFRPEHFQGVALVVDRLLQYVGPCKLYLGQKDIQQFQVIKYMIANTLHKVEPVMCPTIRESNGLAMSSRNKHLGSEEKSQLGVIHDTLTWAAKNILNKSVKDIISDAKEKLLECIYINDVEYFDILKLNDLEPVINISRSETLVVCVALNTNKARLIDNILLFY
ncbi:MAG TPA: hypothetical protein EYQ86_02155, partial [Bacteroidetes bacterium]|nr:hypothetical protein [Bacteroidota bacterium]